MKYKKSEISVAHIVDATTHVLARKGYANTSLMDIAKEAGMSKGAVHYHFPTKEALMTVVLRTSLESVANQTIKAWSSEEEPFESLRAALQKMWRLRAELSNEVSIIADLLTQSLHDQKLREPLAEYYRTATKQVENHLEETLYKLGLESKIPLIILPRMLNALMDGFLMQHIVEPEAVKEEDVINILETLAALVFGFEVNLATSRQGETLEVNSNSAQESSDSLKGRVP